MDFRKWEVVVVEWVNCLKLSKPITCVKDMKDGLFFTGILTLLTQIDSDRSEVGNLTNIVTFLKKQYPNIALDYLGDLLVRDLLEIDLLAISSLLLHYSCIFDRRDVLTSPLCHRLSQTTQIHIRTFLENIKNEITKEELFQIIDSCINKNTKPKSMHSRILQAGDSFLTYGSPLQDLLQTPPSKLGRLQERDREITRLRHEIDLERFEKADLHDELGVQKERNKKLHHQMTDKTGEIIKLRCEIADIENRSLQHCQDDESRELQQRLRSEIDSLEKYIAQLQNEQEELYNERDVLKDRLKKVEGQYMIWHDRSVTTEQKYDKLSEQYQEQELELQNLRMQCLELRTLLEELNALKRSSDSSIEIDMSFSEAGLGGVQEGISCEDLACAVVEVQLRDMQKENAELKSLLKDSQESAKKLNEDWNVVKEDMAKLQIDYEILKIDNNDLLMKASVLTETQTALEDVRRELEQSTQEISVLAYQNTSFNSTIVRLERELDESKTNIITLEESNKVLSIELNTLKTDNIQMESVLSEKSDKCDAFEEQISIMQAEYDMLLENYNTTNFTLQSVTTNLNQLETNMEQSLKKLEKFVFGSNKIDMRDKNTAFAIVFTQLEANYLQQLDDKKVLTDNLSDLETVVVKLKADLVVLNKKDVINLQERQTLTNNLKCADQQILLLEKSIAEHLEKIQNLNYTISDMTTTITDLEMLKTDVEQKEEMIGSLEAATSSLEAKLKESSDELAQSKAVQADLKKSLENLERIKDDFEVKVSEAERKLTEHEESEVTLNQTIAELTALTSIFEQQIFETTEDLKQRKQNEENLQQMLHALESQKTSLELHLYEANDQIFTYKSTKQVLEKSIFDQEKEYQENVKVLSAEIEDYTAKINRLDTELQSCNLNYIAAQRDCEIVSQSKKELQEEMETCKQTFEKRINILDVTLTKLQHDLQTALKEQNSLEKKLDKRGKECEKWKLERDQGMHKYITLEKELKKTLEVMNSKEAECETKDDLLSKANQELLVIKLDVEQKTESMNILEMKLMDKHIQIRELEHHIQAMDSKSDELRCKITELEGECTILQDLKAALEIKCDDLESNAWKILSELSSKNKQLEDLIQKYKEYKEKSENKLFSLSSALSNSTFELEELKKEKHTLASENKEQIDNLQDKILELNQAIESLNSKEGEYLRQIRTMKDELSETCKKYTESLQMRQEIEAENEVQVNTLTKKLRELSEKYNTLDKTNSETILELQNAQARVDCLENQKIQLEAKLVQQKVKYEADYDSFTASLNMRIDELQNRESSLKIELLDVTEKLSNSDENTNSLNNDFRNVCNELSQLKTEKTDLQGKLSKLNNNYQELKKLYSLLKLSHIEFITDNFENLGKLQSEILHQIGILLAENVGLKGTISDFEENIGILRAEQEVVNAIQTEKLEQKDTMIKALEDDCALCKEHISNLLMEKTAIEEQIVIEKAKFINECQNAFDETIEVNTAKAGEYEMGIIKLKCANDILETGEGILHQEISMIVDKIKDLQETKMNDKLKFSKEIEMRDEEVKDLKTKIDLLQIQVTENVTKNNELTLELCTVNESLDSLTRQHNKIQEVLADEKQNLIEKLNEAETTVTNKQNSLETLQFENSTLTQEILSTKQDIAYLKDKLKTDLMERQAIELEIRATNEKLLGQESVTRRQEASISEANSKILGKLEDILVLEREKRTLQEKLEEISKELDKVKRSRDDILESQARIIKETENNLIRAHENAVEVKNDMLQRMELTENENIHEKLLRGDLEKLLDGEKVAKEILELRVLELTNDKSKLFQMCCTLKHSIQSLSLAVAEKPVEIVVDGEARELYMDDFEYLNSNLEMVRDKIVEIMEQKNCYVKTISTLENEKCEITQKIEQLNDENDGIVKEKEQLIKDYNILCNEKSEREQDISHMKDTQLAHEVLKAKYEQLMKYNKTNEAVHSQNVELQEKLAYLEKKTAEAYNTCKKYAGYSSTYKTAIEKLINERNALDNTLSAVKQNLSAIQMKMLHISDEREHTRLMEQVHSFEVIIEDIQKQFLRISRKIHEIILMLVQVPADIYDIVSSEKLAGPEDVFDKIDFEEELEKVIDCKDRTLDLLQQMAAFEGSLRMKTSRVQKENVLRTSNNVNTEVKVKDEELKKRNTMLKQRLTLAENAKNNLEKKIKQLRQENKNLNIQPEPIEDISYKVLLQQHIQAKEEYEKTLNDYKAQYNKLLQEHQDYKTKIKFIPDQIKYEKEMKTELDIKLEREITKLREAYGNVMSDNSKLDLENATMRKLLEDRTSQLSELSLIKETYEKLLEENNKLRMEVDTVKYKRNRDREALYEALQKDRNEAKKIQEVRNEYEGKLEKMKNKMVQLYREEIDKEVQKNHKDQTEKIYLLKTIEQLKHNLKELKTESLKSSSSQSCEFCALPDSIPPQAGDNTYPSLTTQEIVPFKGSGDSALDRLPVVNRRKAPEDRKYATLPRAIGMSVIEENAVLKRNTLSSVPPELGQNLEMEDEDDDLFNNKYLTDLKEGRCMMPSARESTASRLSELKWRNSLCPPHLKSSYPAETQFSNPGHFKEDDLKSGNIDFNESMSTRLIPGEKPRKKDIGTTSYKKPGPPTPSKNGGRLSLQGNEPHPRDVLREQNESKTPKRTTPSRLKALFMGRNSSARDNSENQPGTPRSKRLSFFRKPK